MSEDKVTISFVHPTNPSETLTATITSEATSRYIIDQLIAASFIEPESRVGQYKLRDSSGMQLLDDVTLIAAGVVDGAQLSVDHTVTGAEGRNRGRR